MTDDRSLVDVFTPDEDIFEQIIKGCRDELRTEQMYKDESTDMTVFVILDAPKSIVYPVLAVLDYSKIEVRRAYNGDFIGLHEIKAHLEYGISGSA